MPYSINKDEDFIKIETQNRKNLLINNINKSLNSLKPPITQIFLFKDGRPEQIGTGFYISHENRIYLISAAHVFDDAPENDRWVFDKTGQMCKITGIFYKHRFDCDRDDDLKDLIAIEVGGHLPESFYLDSIFDLEPIYRDGIFAFLGYPGTKNGRVYGKREMKNRTYSYFDRSINATSISSFSYDDNLNILIKYQSKKTITNGVGPNQSPRMKGISGGPVFWITPMSNLSAWTSCNIKLSGVVIHTLERGQYMAGVRIKILLDILSKKSQFQDEFDIIEVLS